MKFVKDARKAAKFWSVQASTVAVFIVMMEPALAHWEGIIPDWAHSAALTVVIAASVILRLIDQGNEDADTTKELSVEDTSGPG